MTHIPMPFIGPIRSFAHPHDNLPAFHAAFIVLTLLAASMFNLGFFGVLILMHMLLDVVKYREVHHLNWRRTWEGVFRESLADSALFMLGFVISVYLHPLLTGVSHLRGIMLAEITIVRGIGLIVPKFKILYDILKLLSHFEMYMQRLHPRFGRTMTIVEFVCILSIGTCFVLLLSAPSLLSISLDLFGHIVLDELIPWKL